MKKSLLLFFLLAVFAASCKQVQYKLPAKDKGSRQWGPFEIKVSADTMVRSLYKYLKDEWGDSALIKIQKIRNRTSEHIETDILTDEISTNLIKLRIQFVDDSYSKDRIVEIEKSLAGVIDQKFAISAGELQSPNLYLFGDINDNVRFVDEKKLQYIVVTLKLQEISTGKLIWQEKQEFLKVSKTSEIEP